MSQSNFQVFGPPVACPLVLPLTDHVTLVADVDVVALKRAKSASDSIRYGSSVRLVGCSMMRPVTDGPRPPTGLMIEEVWVMLWPVCRVVQRSVTRTRL